MTENTVAISITIKVSEREVKVENEIGIGDMEESIQGMMLEAGQQALGMGIKAIDDRIAEKLPRGWQNVGTEERWIVSSIGALRYRRRVYLDENKQRRKPLDELLGVERYGRVNERVQDKLNCNLQKILTQRTRRNSRQETQRKELLFFHFGIFSCRALCDRRVYIL
jgi:hypothetical protein